MQNYELLIFDMDGVLVDSSGCHRRAYEDLWRQIGVEGPPYASIAGRTTAEVIAQSAAALKPSPAQSREWIRFKQEQARRYLATEVITYADTVSALAALARRGIPLALGTGASRDTTEIVLKQLGILDFFATVLTAGDVATGKPSPEIYLSIMAKAAASPIRTLIVEDSQAGLEAAVASGAYVASVRTGRQLNSLKFIGAFTDLRELMLGIGMDAA